MFTETADENDDLQEIQRSDRGECLKPGFQEDSTNRATMIEWLIMDVTVPQIHEQVQQRTVDYDRMVDHGCESPASVFPIGHGVIEWRSYTFLHSMWS